LYGTDFRTLKSNAWDARELNDAALELYGQEKFATLQKSNDVIIEAEKAMVRNAQEVPIRFTTNIDAKSVAIFQTANDQSLVAVFDIQKDMIVDYELNIRMDRKGTLFVVVEGRDNQLYYSRHFLDISSFKCVA
jgi:sulfur-oxidizing protein SoxY